MNPAVAMFLATSLLEELQYDAPDSALAHALDQWITDNVANEQENHAPRHLSAQPA